MAVPPHHQDQGMATSGIAEVRMTTTGAVAAGEKAKSRSNARQAPSGSAEVSVQAGGPGDTANSGT